jgi:hypothetical protein
MTCVSVSRGVRALALAGAVGLILSSSATPAEARPMQCPTVELGSAARLAPDGRSVAIDLVAACPEGWTAVTAVVSVSQPQASGAGSFPLTCIGAARRFTVTVQSSGAPFRLGEAQAAASVVIKRGRTEQAQDSNVVRIEPTVSVDLADQARLEGGGESVSIDVTTACPVGATGQQSYVNVSQGQVSGAGFFVPVCDGLRHTVTVTVRASQRVYKAGSGRALSFAFVEADGNSFAGVDDQPIQIGA